MTTYIRKPRDRTKAAKLDKPGSPTFSQFEDFALPQKLWDDLSQTFVDEPALAQAINRRFGQSVVKPGPAAAQLQEIASAFHRARSQAIPSVSEARYVLGQLEKASVAAHSKPAKRDLAVTLLGNLNDRASSLFDINLRILLKLKKKENLPAWRYSGEIVDWAPVTEAAANAASDVRRGNYGDVDLAVLVEELIILFERVTKTKATFSTRPGGHNATTEPKSAAARFICICARIIDPKLAQTSVLNNIAANLAERRKTAQSV
jgi:hypothetical protein